jgi:hypothetical protein
LKNDLVSEIRNKLGQAWSWTRILPEIKRLGMVYNRKERAIPRGRGASCQGAIIERKFK